MSHTNQYSVTRRFQSLSGAEFEPRSVGGVGHGSCADGSTGKSGKQQSLEVLHAAPKSAEKAGIF